MLQKLPGGELSVHDFAICYEGNRRNQGIRGQTLVREFQCFKRALRIAKRRGLIKNMPDDWPTVRRDPADAKQSGKLRSTADVLAFIKELHEDARDEVEFVALTGLRAAELKRTEYTWVEPHTNGLSVPAILRIPAHAAKNRKERIVGLPKLALEIIHKRFQTNPNSQTIFNQSEHKKALRSASQRAGLTHTLTLRDLRHSCATLALQHTADATAVQAALGHSDLKTTQLYLSATTERIVKAGAAVEALFFSKKGGQ